MEPMKKLIIEYMSKNKGCSYRDIREHAMNRASIYEGACLENYINYVVNYIVDIKLVAKENVPYVLPNGFEDDNLRYTPVPSGDEAKTLVNE